MGRAKKNFMLPVGTKFILGVGEGIMAKFSLTAHNIMFQMENISKDFVDLPIINCLLWGEQRKMLSES